MVPFALKAVWFALSLSGLLSSWFALPAFPRTIVQEAWIPVVYGTADTGLQGVFVLGLIWRMGPLQMPKGFCTAQTVITHVCWSFLAGLCAAVTLKTTSGVFPANLWLRRASGRISCIALVAVFPLVIMAAQLGLLLRLDAAEPVDGLNCDASDPTWVRLLGYAGTSLLLAVPSLVLSITTAIRLAAPQHTRPAATSTGHTIHSHDALTSLPIRRVRTRASPSLRPTDSFQYSLPESPRPTHSALRLPKTLFPHGPIPDPPLSPSRVPSQVNHSKFHLPFVRAPGSVPSSQRPSFCTARDTPVGERSRDGSMHAPSPIIFASPSRAESRPTVVNISPSPHTAMMATSFDPYEDDSNEGDDGSITEVHHQPYVSVEDGAVGSFRWVRDVDSQISKAKDELGYGDELDAEPSQYAFPPYPRIRKSPSGIPPWLDEPIDPAPPPSRRLVAFQIYLSSTLVVASITSLVDIFARRRPPAPFGTQHVALLLAGWGPFLFVCVLRHIPSGPRTMLALCRR